MKTKMKTIGIVASLCITAAVLSVAFAADQNPTSEVKDVWNTALSSGVDLLSTPLQTTKVAGRTIQSYDTTYRCMIALVGTSSVVNLHVTNISDSTTQDFAINGGTALSAGSVYNFSFNASASFKYNFRVGTTTTIGIFSADRVGNNQ